jgi:FtsH-binding integral membrane protein
VVIFAPLGLVFFISARIQSMSVNAAQISFWIFSALMGASIASIFLVYSGESIARVFFITAAAFGGLSLWGYTTKRDLSGFGSFLIMGVVGILVAMLINIFLQSSAMAFAISVIGVLLFAGLTAYDTQRIKSMYAHVAGTDFMGKSVIMGALSLYLDFVNMFMFLLQLFGGRRN